MCVHRAEPGEESEDDWMTRLPRASTIAEAIDLLQSEDSPRAINSILKSLAESLRMNQDDAKQSLCDILKIAIRVRPSMSAVLEKLKG